MNQNIANGVLSKHSINMSFKLQKLDQYALGLKTGCQFRDAEIDNIRTIIIIAIKTHRGNMENVERRLAELAQNINYAGHHEKFKPKYL